MVPQSLAIAAAAAVVLGPIRDVVDVVVLQIPQTVQVVVVENNEPVVQQVGQILILLVVVVVGLLHTREVVGAVGVGVGVGAVEDGPTRRCPSSDWICCGGIRRPPLALAAVALALAVALAAGRPSPPLLGPVAIAGIGAGSSCRLPAAAPPPPPSRRRPSPPSASAAGSS